MELLNYPKNEYLLDAPLDALHAESVAWLKELGFWADEVSFFYKLLHHHKLSDSFPSDQVAEIDKELVKFNGEKLNRVKSGVASHEHLLASLFKSSSMADEQVYRETHRKLSIEVHSLYEDIRAFRQKIFSFI